MKLKICSCLLLLSLGISFTTYAQNLTPLSNKAYPSGVNLKMHMIGDTVFFIGPSQYEYARPSFGYSTYLNLEHDPIKKYVSDSADKTPTPIQFLAKTDNQFVMVSQESWLIRIDFLDTYGNKDTTIIFQNFQSSMMEKMFIGTDYSIPSSFTMFGDTLLVFVNFSPGTWWRFAFDTKSKRLVKFPFSKYEEKIGFEINYFEYHEPYFVFSLTNPTKNLGGRYNYGRTVIYDIKGDSIVTIYRDYSAFNVEASGITVFNDSIYLLNSTNRFLGQHAPGLSMLSRHNLNNSYSFNQKNNYWTNKIWNQEEDGSVRSICKDSAGYSYIFLGSSDKINGGFHGGICRLSPKGIIDPNFRYEEDIKTSNVKDMLLIKDKLYLGGSFHHVTKSGVQDTTYILRVLDAKSGKIIKDLFWERKASSEATDLSAGSKYLYIGGYITINQGGKKIENLFRVDIDNLNIDTSWTPFIRNFYSDVSIIDSFLFLGANQVITTSGTKRGMYYGLNLETGKELDFGIARKGELRDILRVNDTFFLITEYGLYQCAPHNGGFKSDTLLNGSFKYLRHFDGHLVFSAEDWVLSYNLNTGKTDSVLYSGQIFDIEVGETINVGGNFSSSHLSNSRMVKNMYEPVLRLDPKTHTIIDVVGKNGFIRHGTKAYYLESSDSILHLVHVNDSLSYRTINLKDHSISDHTLGSKINASNVDVDPKYIFVKKDTLYVGAFWQEDSLYRFDARSGTRYNALIPNHDLPASKYNLKVYDSVYFITNVLNDINVSIRDSNKNRMEVTATKINEIHPIPLTSPEPFKIVDRSFTGAGQLFVQYGNITYRYDRDSNTYISLLQTDTKYPVSCVIGDYLIYSSKDNSSMRKTNWRSSSSDEKFYGNKANTVVGDTNFVYLITTSGGPKAICLSFKTGSQIWSTSIPSFNDIKIMSYKDYVLLFHYSSKKTMLYFLSKTDGKIIGNRLFPRGLEPSDGFPKMQIVGDVLYYQNEDKALPDAIHAYHIPSATMTRKDFNHILDADPFDFDIDGDSSLFFLTKGNYTYGENHYFNGYMISKLSLARQEDYSEIYFEPRTTFKQIIDIRVFNANLDSTSEILFIQGMDTFRTKHKQTNLLTKGFQAVNLDARNMKLGYADLLICSTSDTVLHENALQINEKLEPNLSIFSDLSNNVRFKQPVFGNIFIHNNGQQDLYWVPFFLNSSTNLNLRLKTNILNGSELDDLLFAKYKMEGIPSNERTSYHFTLPRIPANQTIAIPISIYPTSEDLDFHSWLGIPLMNNSIYDSTASEHLLIQDFLQCTANIDSTKLQNCIDQEAVKVLSKNTEKLDSMSVLGLDLNRKYSGLYPNIKSNNLIHINDLYVNVVKCVDANLDTNVVLKSWNQLQSVLSTLDTTDLKECEKKIFEEFGQPITQFKNQFSLVNSLDPNRKDGPTGTVSKTYSNNWDSLSHFNIHFENDPKASGPAQKVIIRDTLNSNYFDISSIQFTNISIGSYRYWVDQNTSDIKDLLISPSSTNEYNVRINAKVDYEHNYLEVLFETVDFYSGATTSLPASLGFLPPNNSSGDGHAHIGFTIKTKYDTLGTLQNRASIVFDENKQILTEYWHQTRDTTPPETFIQTEWKNDDELIKIQWNAKDSSGILRSDLFVSTNGSKFIHKKKLEDKTLSWKANCDSSYIFFIQSTDSAGNRDERNSKNSYHHLVKCSNIPKLITTSKIDGLKGIGKQNYVRNDAEINYSYEVSCGASDGSIGIREFEFYLEPKFKDQFDFISIDSFFIGPFAYRGTKAIEEFKALDTTINGYMIRIQIYKYGDVRKIRATLRQPDIDSIISGKYGFVHVTNDTLKFIKLYITSRFTPSVVNGASLPLYFSSLINETFALDTIEWVVRRNTYPPKTYLSLNIDSDSQLFASWISSGSFVGIRKFYVTTTYRGDTLMHDTFSPNVKNFNLKANKIGAYVVNVLGEDSLGQIEKPDAQNRKTVLVKPLSTDKDLFNHSPNIIISPNPNQGWVQIKNKAEPLSWRLIDATGKLVESGSIPGNSERIISMRKGFYYIVLSSPNGTSTYKLTSL